MDKWTSYIDKQHYHVHESMTDDKHFIVLEARTDDVDSYHQRLTHVPEEQQIMVCHINVLMLCSRHNIIKLNYYLMGLPIEYLKKNYL